MRTIEIDALCPTPGVDARAPGVVRREADGYRTYWRGRDRPPTPEEREAAKMTFRKNDRGPLFSARCAFCGEGGMETAVTSDCVDIQKTGLCGYCGVVYDLGRLDGTVVRRAPTLEEALAHLDDARSAEVRVLLAELKQLRALA